MATPRGTGYGDTSCFGLLKAWDWSLRPTRLTLVSDVPSATSTCAQICNYSFTLCEFFTWSTAAAGNYAYAWTWTSGVNVSTAPGGVLPLTSNLLASNHPVDYASGTAYLRSGLPIRHQLLNLPGFPSSTSSSSITSSCGTSIFLFYVIGFFFVYKIIFVFLFF